MPMIPEGARLRNSPIGPRPDESVAVRGPRLKAMPVSPGGEPWCGAEVIRYEEPSGRSNRFELKSGTVCPGALVSRAIRRIGPDEQSFRGKSTMRTRAFRSA